MLQNLRKKAWYIQTFFLFLNAIIYVNLVGLSYILQDGYVQCTICQQESFSKNYIIFQER